MQATTLLVPLAAALSTHCGGEVPLENRPCPCSPGWTCCSNLICAATADQCPPPPPVYCLPGWTLAGTSCVYSAKASVDVVCRFPDSKFIQEDVRDDLDWCAATNDPDGLHRVLVCANFYGTVVAEMTVTLAEHLVQPGPDKCILHASPLLRDAASPP